MRRAAVVGAGIGGLSAAIALRKIGFDVQLFERAPALREVGSGISVWPNALRSLQEIDPLIPQRLAARGRAMRRLLLKESDGTLAKAIEFPEADFTGLAIHRADLHSTLADFVPSETIHLDHTFSRVKIRGSSAVVQFVNGAEIEADLVIGSDGIHSAVRDNLGFRSRLNDRGYVVWRSVAPAEEPVDLASLGLEKPGDFSETYGPGQRFGIMCLGGGRLHWYATARREDPSADEGSREEVQRLFAGWHSPIPELIGRSNNIFFTRVYDRPPSLPWTAGPIALLGDAAHAISPDFGQGACLAIEDAVVLASSLKSEKRILPGLLHYQQARYKRCREAFLASRETGRLVQFRNKLLVRMRNRFIRLAPPGFTMFWLRRSWNFSPPALSSD